MVTKHEVEKVIVPRAGTAVPIAGARLFNATTNVLNLPVGGFGFYIDAPGSGNPVAVTGTAATGVFNTGSVLGLPATVSAGTPVRVIMRRDISSDASVLAPRYTEESQYISTACAQGLLFGGEAYSAGSVSSWVLGAPTTLVGDINTVNNTAYVLQASATGYRIDMFSSLYNHPTAHGRYTSPDWTTTSYNTVPKRLDYVVKALVEDFNLQSTGSSQTSIAVALAISTADGPDNGASPAVSLGTGINIAGVSVNDVIVIGYDRYCRPINLLVTADRKAALNALEARLLADFSIALGTAEIVPYVLPGSCSAAPGTHVFAGTTTTADMIFLMAIDPALAAYDELSATRTSILASLTENGSIVTDTSRREVSFANEGAGIGRNLKLMHDAVEHYKSYSSSKTWGANHVAYSDEIVASGTYNIYTVQHCHNRMASSGLPSISPLLTTIGINTTDGTQKAYAEAVLGAMAKAAGKNPVTL